jgi:hypothetical protein
MSRVGILVCVLGLWAAPAVAKEAPQLSAPTLTARQQRSCGPEQRAVCPGIGRRAVQSGDLDLLCDGCGMAATGERAMPAEIMAPPANKRPSANKPSAVECGMSDMPFGPNPPGCTPPPLDNPLPIP